MLPSRSTLYNLLHHFTLSASDFYFVFLDWKRRVRNYITSCLDNNMLTLAQLKVFINNTAFCSEFHL